MEGRHTRKLGGINCKKACTTIITTTKTSRKENGIEKVNEIVGTHFWQNK